MRLRNKVSVFGFATSVALFLAGPAFAAPTIEVLDSGSGPKQVLAFTPSVGATQSVAMKLKMGMEMSMGGQTMPQQSMPAMVMLMKSTVEKVEANGDIHYSFVVDGAEVEADPQTDQMLIDAMKQQVQGIVGLKGLSIVDAQGVPKDVKYEVPEEADASMKDMYAQMSDSLDQMGAPLPKSAVGVGAKWRVVQKVDQRGMTINQTTHYELKELKGSTVKIGLALQQGAPAQDVDAPGMPPGASAKLLSLDSTGTGQLQLDLAQMFPTESQLDLSSDMQMEISAEGQSMQMGMKMVMGMSLSSQ